MRRVLVVEDETPLRQGLVTALDDAGFEVVQAVNGREAMAALEASDPRIGLLFTDIRLAGLLDGWAIADRARVLNPDVRVVYATKSAADAQRQLPNSRCLVKPYEAQAVVESFADMGA